MFVGSGMSANYGLPTMRQLADEMISRVNSDSTEQQKIAGSADWKTLYEALVSGIGLERALIDVKDADLKADLRGLVVRIIQDSETEVLKDIVHDRAGHGLRRLLSHGTRVPRQLSIVTTNYDRLIEVTAERLGIEVNTSFPGKYCSKHNPSAAEQPFISRSQRKRRGSSRSSDDVHYIRLLKPHGCLSWYRLDDHVISSGIELDLDRVLIAPTSDKYQEGYEQVYSYHRDKANEALSSANSLLVIGYGFGDVHLEEVLIQRIRSSISTVVLTRTIPDRLRELVVNANSTLVIGRGSDEGRTALLASGTARQEIECAGGLWNVDQLMQEALGGE